MTYEHGAALCLKLGRHRFRKVAPGVERCADCTETRTIDLADDEIEAYRLLLHELQ